MSLFVAKRLALGLLVGGGLGYVWHRLVGCSTGACPLTATPLRGILYGAFMGVVWALSGRAQS
ncbi:MAG: YtxH domain-containing protein [Acidobacteria bacterium]|nr:YtxH domain-containing protein [Acidobacteriota bacterium]